MASVEIIARELVGDFVGYVEAARMVGVRPATLRHYLWSKTPKGRPFPQPDLRVAGKPLWRRVTIAQWQASRLGAGYRTDLRAPESLTEG